MNKNRLIKCKKKSGERREAVHIDKAKKGKGEWQMEMSMKEKR